MFEFLNRRWISNNAHKDFGGRFRYVPGFFERKRFEDKTIMEINLGINPGFSRNSHKGNINYCYYTFGLGLGDENDAIKDEAIKRLKVDFPWVFDICLSHLTTVEQFLADSPIKHHKNDLFDRYFKGIFDRKSNDNN